MTSMHDYRTRLLSTIDNVLHLFCVHNVYNYILSSSLGIPAGYFKVIEYLLQVLGVDGVPPGNQARGADRHPARGLQQLGPGHRGING